MVESKTNILIADDHSIIRKGLISIINSIDRNINFLESSTLKETKVVLKNNFVEYLILDISFQNQKSIDIINYAKEKNAEISILIFSMHDEIELVVRYLKEGANGYLSKNSSETQIKEALVTFIEKKRYLDQKTKDQIIDSIYLTKKGNPIKLLSNREYEVAKLLIIGKTTSEISYILDLKSSTISTLKSRVFDKLKIKSVVSLVEIFNLHN